MALRVYGVFWCPQRDPRALRPLNFKELCGRHEWHDRPNDAMPPIIYPTSRGIATDPFSPISCTYHDSPHLFTERNEFCKAY